MTPTRAFWVGLLLGLVLCGAMIAVLLTMGARDDERQELRQGFHRIWGGPLP